MTRINTGLLVDMEPQPDGSYNVYFENPWGPGEDQEMERIHIGTIEDGYYQVNPDQAGFRMDINTLRGIEMLLRHIEYLQASERAKS